MDKDEIRVWVKSLDDELDTLMSALEVDAEDYDDILNELKYAQIAYDTVLRMLV